MRVLAAAALVLGFACSRGSEPERAAPTEPAWQPDRSCAAHDECRPAPSCCPMPCNGDVINVKDMDRAQKELRRTCPETPDDCPQAGSCPGHEYMCIQGSCKLVMEGDPEYPGSP